MRYHVSRPFARVGLLIAGLAVSVVACGDDGGGARTAFPDLPATPFELTTAERGLFAYPTDSVGALSATFSADALLADNLVFYEQIWSEAEQVRSAGGAAPPFDARLTSFYADPAFRPTLDTFETSYWVVDLHRLNREWLVDWTGGVRDEPDARAASMTFGVRAAEHSSDYQQAIAERLFNALRSDGGPPDRLVIGAEMDRHYLAASGDWPAFTAFLRSLVNQIRAEYPEMEIGVGFNWSHFMDAVVPTFVNAANQSSVNLEVVRVAWQTVIDPIYFTVERDAEGRETGATPFLDFYAFSAVPDASLYPGGPNQMPDEHFAGIPGYFEVAADRELSVAWFMLGWPSTSPSSQFWGDFLTRFLQSTGGYAVDLVSWWGYSHLSNNECGTYTAEVGLQLDACYRGLYTRSGADTGEITNLFFGR